MFRGEDGETREPVVIKVVRVGLPAERAAVVGAALASLCGRIPSHPALAACCDAGVVDVEPYIVSAYVDGDSLDVALREYGPALLVDALPRLRLLADGLDLAATAGIAHGSLHPRDILVAVEHTVLQGLGVAGVLERVGVRPPVRRPYCAPEVALGLGISPAGDQYSLAAVAHEWLTGRRLAAGQEQAVRVPGLTGDAAETMRAVFARALAEAPSDRFPTATAFIEAIAELAPHAAGRPKPARRQPAATPPRLAFDEPDEPEEPAAPAPASPVVAAITASSLSSAGELADDLEDAELAVDTAASRSALVDLPITRVTPDTAPAWDENPLSEFTVTTGEAAQGRAAAIRDEAVVAADDPEDDVVTDDGADDVVPDDEVDRPHSPVIVAGAGPAPDVVAVSLPIHEAGPTSWDDEASTAEPTADDDVDEAAAAGVDQGWRTWVVGIVAFTLLAIGGGWLLVRWGTPSALRQGERAAVEAPAPSAMAPPQAAVPTETRAEPSTPSTGSSAPPTSGAPPTPAAQEPPRPTPVPASSSETSRPAPPAPSRPPAAAPRPTAAAARAGRPRSAAAQPPAQPPRTAPPRQTPTAPASAAAPAENAARLLVRSTPGGAEVFVNGERRGVTPLALRDLPLGSHAVRITRAGYAAVDERVVLERGRPSRSLEVTLTRADAGPTPPSRPPPPAARPGRGTPTTGILVVETRPPGARVIVDGNDAGASPVTLPALAAGSHRLRIERAGYTPITTTTTIEAGARARVAVTLTPERP